MRLPWWMRLPMDEMTNGWDDHDGWEDQWMRWPMDEMTNGWDDHDGWDDQWMR